jgi:DNA ligase-associated metallophosphoesterase
VEQVHVGEIEMRGQRFCGDSAGALYWAAERILIVADLHLEKGSSFARRGVLLPPYDTAATLASLAKVIARHDPRLVIALGDSFHDGEGAQRLAATDRRTLLALQNGRDWIWISGNHDPDPAAGIGGVFCDHVALGPFVFRHEPGGTADENEIAGHLHPVARVSLRGRAVSRKCFASDGHRLVMPAFGAYTGGLNVRDRAFAAIFGALDFTAHMLGPTRLYAISAAYCLPD